MLGQSERFGEIGGVAERLPRRRGVADPRLGISESKQQLAACHLVAGERQCRLVVTHGFLVCKLGSRAITGVPRVFRRLVRQSGWSSGQEVARELGQVRLDVGRVELLQRLARLPVELDPPRRREVVVERVPDEGMTKAQPAGCARHFVHDAFRHGFVQDVQHFVSADAR